MTVNEVGLFALQWPGALSIWDMNRLVRAKRTCSIPDELGRLAGKGVKLTSEEAYSLIDQIMVLWEQLGFYPLDASKDPEEWAGDDELPTCVLATTSAQYVDYNDMHRIVRLYDGKNLPDYLPEDERQARLRRQRHRPVLTTSCRQDGCDEQIVVTVAMAARAIKAHKLIEREDVYEPSTLCKKHRAERDEILAQKRQGRGSGGLKVPMKQAAKWTKKKEVKPDVDSSVTASSPVAEEAPPPQPPEQEAAPQPQEERQQEQPQEPAQPESQL